MLIRQSAQDGVLDDLALATTLVVCSAEPADYAGIAAVSLGSIGMVGGDYAKSGAAGATRVLTTTPPAGSTYDSNGTAAFLAFHDGVELVRTVDLVQSKAVYAADPIDVAAFAFNVPAAPTAV